jgi:molybdopterin/thiamine biosynthesis adenylyltransferase
MINIIRHSGIFNPTKHNKLRIGIIGLGAIGSGVTEALVRMGFNNFELLDYDTIEDHNISNQLYFNETIGESKVEACAKKLLMINKDLKIIKRKEMFGEETELNSDIIIIATDNMLARKNIVNNAIKQKRAKILIDGRMSGLNFTVHTIRDLYNKLEVDFYWKHWFPDDKKVNERCSEKTIIYNVLGVSSFIVEQLVKVLKKELAPRFINFDYKSWTLVTLK